MQPLRFISLLLCVLFLKPNHAQFQKLHHTLLQKHKNNTNQLVDVIIQGDAQQVKTEVEKNGGTILYSTSNFSRAKISIEGSIKIAASNSIQFIEAPIHHLKVMDDSSIIKNNILPIHNGNLPLTQAYDGTGVIIGIIDTGTDFNHPDFKDANGKTRILSIWDQRSPNAANTPMPYNYGQAWDSSMINAGTCTHTDINDVGHGTKVAGVAAGNGISAPAYKGIAPNANIITVAIDFTKSGPTIADAVDYIMNQASAFGMPCVINLSLGDYYGSHDGMDLESQLITSLFAGIPGRALVAAGGNAGEYPIHLGYTASADTNFTWITNTDTLINFQIYSDTLDFKNIDFSIGYTNKTNLAYAGNIGFKNINYCLGVSKTDTIKNGLNQLGIVQTFASLNGKTYTLDITIDADSINQWWSFEVKGSGKFDSWSPEFVTTSLPNSIALPKMQYHKRADSLQTIVTGVQCSDEVITVANYVDRDGFVDVNNAWAFYPGPVDDLMPSSSRGPTRDGRTKPDIAATGENIATVGSLPWLTWLIANFPFAVTQDSLHMTFGGTSAASPCVTGLVALYLQKNPTATNTQIRNNIMNCAAHDAFTGTGPDNEWGYGKLDGYNTLLCSSIGINNVTQKVKNFEVYPNPFTNELKVSNTSKTWCKISIVNLLGENCFAALYSNDETITLHLDELNRGIYLIRLDSEMGRESYKIIKQ